jgi:hypothetical protein
MDTLDSRWEDLARKHEASLDRFLARANELDEAAWEAPIADGKWTPIEITEHLRAAYDVVIKELTGGQGMKLRSNALVRRLIKLVYLPRILRTRRMPPNVKAPSEIRPRNCIRDRAEALAALKAIGLRAQKEIGDRRHDPKAYATHFVLGKIKPLEGMDFLTIHLEHHTRQLPNA